MAVIEHTEGAMIIGGVHAVEAGNGLIVAHRDDKQVEKFNTRDDMLAEHIKRFPGKHDLPSLPTELLEKVPSDKPTEVLEEIERRKK